MLYFVVKHLLCFVVARYYYMPGFCSSFIVVIHCGIPYEIGMENKLRSPKCTERRSVSDGSRNDYYTSTADDELGSLLLYWLDE